MTKEDLPSSNRGRCFAAIALIASALQLSSCGGGGGGGGSSVASTGTTPAAAATIYSFVGQVTAPVLTGDFATDAFNETNYVRAKLGLNALNRVAALNTSAINHSNYFANNGVSGSGAGGFHNEAAGRPGFTGVAPGDRAAAAGYGGGSVSENMSIGSGSGTGATTGLIAVPYHRFTQLSGYADAGAGFSQNGKVYTIDFGGKAANWGPSANQLVVLPAAGQIDVSIGTSSDEVPNPLPDIPPRQVGYPISILGAVGETLTISSISLTDPQGKSIGGRLVTTNTENGAPLGNYGFFIPLPTSATGMLERNTTYAVAASGTYRGVVFALTWNFTTMK